MIRHTISEIFLERVRTTPYSQGFQFKSNDKQIGGVAQWKTITFEEFYHDCRLVSFGLMSLGVQPADRVAILVSTRYEWALWDMATLGALAVIVPIYPSVSVDTVFSILYHSESKILLVEDSEQLEKILKYQGQSPDIFRFLEKILVLETSAMMLASKYPDKISSLLTLQALRELGKREAMKNPNRFDENLIAAKKGDVTSICYTPGTTGRPKGVVMTHDNWVSVLEDYEGLLGKNNNLEKDKILSFLPCSHIFGKIEFLATFAFGWKQVFAETRDQVFQNCSEVQPTLFFCSSEWIENIYKRIQNSLNQLSPIQKKLFNWAYQLGVSYHHSSGSQKLSSIVLKVQYQVALKGIFKNFSKELGGKIRYLIFMGSSLSPDVIQFFQILGIDVLEGYGLTETSGLISLNLPWNKKLGSVGKSLPEVVIKIAEDGEILVKSRKLFQAYYKMETEFQKVFKDGWFYTGDLGEIDSEGFIDIKGRKSDLILTSRGGLIHPQKIESFLRTQIFIHEGVVQEVDCLYLVVLLFLERTQILQYANEYQILFSEYRELIKNPKILALLQKKMDEVNQKLSKFESIKKFMVLPNDLSVEGGELTPTFKIRRQFVQKKFAREIETLSQADS